MHGESEILLPVSEPRLRAENRAHRRFETDDDDLSPPRKEERPAETFSRLGIDDCGAAGAQNFEPEIADDPFELMHDRGSDSGAA